MSQDGRLFACDDDSGDEDGDTGLNEVLVIYFGMVDRGEQVDREEFIRDHIEYEDELHEYFANADGVACVCEPSETLPHGQSEQAPPDVIGDYELLGEIARGGMGVVYRARQLSLQRIVAVKMILGRRLAGPTDVDRFYREARAAANLKHPNIVPVYEVGERDGQHFFSMGYIEGKSLAELTCQEPLECKRAAAYLKQVAGAVHYAHQRGTLHRDLKPSNILVDSDDAPHVTDFGLARQVEEDARLTASEAILGSPPYMPPEQATGKQELIGPASDVYSLGATLYDLLTGRPPFQALTPGATLEMVRSDEPKSPRALNPLIGRDLETICLKCLDKEVHRRYSSAEAFADDLGRYLAGEPILARPIGTLQRLWRWCKRKPVLASLIAAITGLLLFLAVAGPIVALDQAALRHEAEGEKALADIERDGAKAARKRESKERRRAEKLLYLGRVTWAEKYWREHDIAKAEAQLDVCPAELRDWEWSYLKRLCHSEMLTLRGHSAAVSSVSFSPDGKHIASGSWDNTIKVWNAETGEETQTLSGHTGFVTSIAFSSDGTQLVSGSNDACAKIWDLASGRELLTLRGHDRETEESPFSLDALTRLFVGEEITPHVEPSTEQQLMFEDELSRIDDWDHQRFAVPHFRYIRAVAFSPDGSWVATGGMDNTARVWDAKTGKQRCTLRGHSSYVTSLSFSPDGDEIVSASNDGTVRIWSASTGKMRLRYDGLLKNTPKGDDYFGGKHVTYPRSVNFGPGGKRVLATSMDGYIKVLDPATAREFVTIGQHADSITSACFTRDGNSIVWGSEDGSVRMSKAATGELLRVYRGHYDRVSGVSVSPDGTRIASASWDGTIRVWDATAEQGSRTFGGQEDKIESFAFFDSGETLASYVSQRPPRFVFWDAASGQKMGELEVTTKDLGDVLLGPNGDLYVSWPPLHVWHPRSKEMKWLEGLEPDLGLAALSPDGRRFVAGLHTGQLAVWDCGTGQRLCHVDLDELPIACLAFDAVGERVAAGSKDGRVLIADSTSGKELLTLFVWSEDYLPVNLTSVAFSPDGTRLAGGIGDNTARIWDATTGEEVQVLSGHLQGNPLQQRGVTSVAFSPSGARVLTGGADNAVKLWDATTGQELLTFLGHEYYVDQIMFDADGMLLATHSRDGEVRIWDGRPIIDGDVEHTNGP